MIKLLVTLPRRYEERCLLSTCLAIVDVGLVRCFEEALDFPSVLYTPIFGLQDAMNYAASVSPIRGR